MLLNLGVSIKNAISQTNMTTTDRFVEKEQEYDIHVTEHDDEC